MNINVYVPASSFNLNINKLIYVIVFLKIEIGGSNKILYNYFISNN